MIVNWFKKRNEKKILDALALQLNDPQSIPSKRVEEKANIVAVIYVMRWFDMKGIRHCAACPSTDTLRKNGTQFFCPQHTPKMQVVANA